MGDRDRNVGQLDRLIRVPLGMIAVIAVAWIYLRYSVQPGTIALMLLFGSIMLIMFTSAATGTCGIYRSLGIDTAPESVDSSPDQTWGQS